MDQFVITSNPAMDNKPAQPNPTPQTPSQPPQLNKPKNFFRVVFLLLLIATLVSAAATTYILISGKQKGAPVQAVPISNTSDTTITDNAVVETNPFDSENTQVNPFGNTEETDNIFSEFETDSVTATGEYQNPF